jgi:hypothetical protein
MKRIAPFPANKRSPFEAKRNPELAYTLPRFAFLVLCLRAPPAPADGGSCRERDGNLANARWRAARHRLPARNAVLDHRPNGVFRHGRRFALVLAVAKITAEIIFRY